MERPERVEKEGSEWRLEGEKEDTYIGKDGPRERERREEGRTDAEVVGRIVARIGIYSWPG